MTKRVRRCNLTDTILDATISAYREYIRICDFTMGVNETPEYWYTTAITLAIARTYSGKNIYPVLEDSVESIKSSSGSKARGPVPANLRANGRTDVALWKYGRKDWIPISFIEVKRGNGWGGKPFENDVLRILSALDKLGSKNDGAIEGGFFVVVSDHWGSSDKENRSYMIEKFKKEIGDIKAEIGELTDKNRFNGYQEFSEYNREHKTMGSAIVFKIK